MRTPLLVVLASLLLLAPACGGAGGAPAAAPVAKTEADALVGVYAAAAFTRVWDWGLAESERDVVSYSGSLALRADGTYVETLEVDGRVEVDTGAWSAQYGVIHLTPEDGSCEHDAVYSVLADGAMLQIEARQPCDAPYRLTRIWRRDQP